LRKVIRGCSPIGYNAEMARGWESKSVEEQISAREAEAQRSAKTTFTPQQRELQSRRDGLLLMRTRTLSAIQSARDEVYRKQQEHALAHLDAELAQLETLSTKS
jgi:hypothetical protein